jgi:alkylglycerol monooxygenase
MDMELIAWGYPFFVLLIALELFWSRKKNLKLYRFADTLTALACGVSSQALGVLLAFVAIGVYAWVYQFRFFTLSSTNPLVWIAALLYVDLAFYWWHRIGHEVNFMWATHGVHHQSEDYNLAVALRQEWGGHVTHFPFYLPLALLGFSWQLVATQVAISLLYQFWIHTEVIKRMGPFEWIFNAPMHHRVHHAINPQYLDKNYGGILVIWDRLFGTFEAEVQPCVYGTTTPIASWNPLWANGIVWAHMWQASRQTARLRDKIGVWLRSPAWSPADLPAHPPKPVDRAKVVKYDTPVPMPLKIWLGGQLLVATMAQALLPKMDRPLAIAVTALILWTLLNIGGVLERKRWADTSESGRIAALVVLAWTLQKLGLWQVAMWPFAVVTLLLAAVFPLVYPAPRLSEG